MSGEWQSHPSTLQFTPAAKSSKVFGTMFSKRVSPSSAAAAVVCWCSASAMFRPCLPTLIALLGSVCLSVRPVGVAEVLCLLAERCGDKALISCCIVVPDME